MLQVRGGGAFRYSENGDKDCSLCQIPHKRENYGRVLERYGGIAELTKKK